MPDGQLLAAPPSHAGSLAVPDLLDEATSSVTRIPAQWEGARRIATDLRYPLADRLEAFEDIIDSQVGDPTKASREKGERTWDIMTRNLVELVEHIKGMSLNQIYQRNRY